MTGATVPPDNPTASGASGTTDQLDQLEPVEPIDPDVLRSNRRTLLVILTGFLLVVTAFGASMFLDRSEEPIGDARAPVQAACDSARAELKALGKVDPDIELADLAERIDTETGILRRMVTRFAAADTGNRPGQNALDAWITDWSALLDARDRAADDRRAGDATSKWLPAEAPGKAKAIDGRMDEYARRENVGHCTTTVLEADNLDGQRNYPDPKD
jgi:hypothetical protein